MRSSALLSLLIVAVARAHAHSHTEAARPGQDFVQDDVEELQRKWGFEVGSLAVSCLSFLSFSSAETAGCERL